MNILFLYQYRDAANYKLHGQAVFTNPDSLSLEQVENKIREKLIAGEFFVPENWGIARKSFTPFDPETDHQWHEFVSVIETDMPATEKKTILEFLVTLTNEKTIRKRK